MSWRHRTAGILALSLATLWMAASAAAAGFADLEQRVVEQTLSNGLKVLILPRPFAPVVSMVTFADVGSVDENQNATGLAHIFEHMAFKGTATIGTTDLARELEAMAKEDEAFAALRAERMQRPNPDPERLKQLEETFAAAVAEARQYVRPNELGEIVERAGGQGLNAGTSFDQTVYMYSLPSNKLELWATLEADRFTNPVLREFYTEKDVIMEERRMAMSQPVSRLIEDFLAVAFKASMYRSFVIGHMSDLEGITRNQAREWFARYYGARNLTVAIVGDVDPMSAMPMLERTLGAIPAGSKPGPVVTEEPPQRAEKRIIMEDPSQPILFMGFHRGDVNDPDYAVYEALSELLAGGRSSRLYTSLVKDKKIALDAGAMSDIGQKTYPGLFLFYAVPNKGNNNAECEAAIDEEIARLQREPVSAAELEGVRARVKASFLRSVGSNMGLAMQLASAENLNGDWREAFRWLDRIDEVTAADIMRVATATFTRSNRTVGLIETATAPAAAAAAP
jgi:predicted Zn-dependent peptidase